MNSSHSQRIDHHPERQNWVEADLCALARQARLCRSAMTPWGSVVSWSQRLQALIAARAVSLVLMAVVISRAASQLAA